MRQRSILLFFPLGFRRATVMGTDLLGCSKQMVHMWHRDCFWTHPAPRHLEGLCLTHPESQRFWLEVARGL